MLLLNPHFHYNNYSYIIIMNGFIVRYTISVVNVQILIICILISPIAMGIICHYASILQHNENNLIYVYTQMSVPLI